MALDSFKYESMLLLSFLWCTARPTLILSSVLDISVTFVADSLIPFKGPCRRLPSWKLGASDILGAFQQLDQGDHGGSWSIGKLILWSVPLPLPSPPPVLQGCTWLRPTATWRL